MTCWKCGRDTGEAGPAECLACASDSPRPDLIVGHFVPYREIDFTKVKTSADGRLLAKWIQVAVPVGTPVAAALQRLLKE